MKKWLFFLLFPLQVTFAIASPPKNNPAYFELRVYHYTASSQETTLDSFFQSRFLPALHSYGLNHIGVFKAIANDTAADKKMYVFIPFNSLKQWDKLSAQIRTDVSIGGSFVDAAYNNPAFTRMENIFLKSFELAPPVTSSKLTGPKSDRVYELRSYESGSEKIFRNKVEMFNQGGEIDLFARLAFNSVFYSEVMFGSKMPNLMYMTSFDNMQSREEHWKAFVADPAWKSLSGMKEYQNNVQHIDINFLRATEYSDL